VTRHYASHRDSAQNLAAATLWHITGPFRIVRLLGPQYLLRCAVFHHIADAESSFTRGLGVTTTRRNFEAALKFLTKYYTPVSLQDIVADGDGRTLPPRPLLVTFDDAYASIAEFAAPLCRNYGVPAVLFTNAAYLDNEQLALDNLICHAVNVLGLDRINAVANASSGIKEMKLRSMAQIFAQFLPAISLQARTTFRHVLTELVETSEHDLAAKAGLYLTRKQLRELAANGLEIGNHTYTHVHCRSLGQENFFQEIDRNKAELEAASGRRVRSFSLPYGSAADLTIDVARHLRLSGHEVVFLSESVANSRDSGGFQFDRVSLSANSNHLLFFEIEVLPRLRAIRNRLSRTRT
jgi:peptidoglycan/xylan/chitin deacetylase (PgdA/CDA1 family)